MASHPMRRRQKQPWTSWKKPWVIIDPTATMRRDRTAFLYPLFFVACLLLQSIPSPAQKGKKQKETAPVLTRIEFLFDASQSMYGRWQSGMKIDVAKRLMSEMLDSLKHLDNIELALRLYGHQKNFPPQD